MLSRLNHIAKRITNKAPIINADRFIDWLSFANAGMLEKGNVYCFEYAVKNLPSESPILEIGSFCGLSTNAINHYLSLYGKKNKFFSSDKWEFEGSDENKTLGNSSITHADYRTFVKESFMRNVKFFSRNNVPHTIEVFSDDFFKIWSEKKRVKDIFDREVELGGKFSFVYIDGNHTYEFAKRDFENADKNLEIGGFILFDDSSVYSRFGCALLMKEIVKMKQYELVMKNPNFLFRKIS